MENTTEIEEQMRMCEHPKNTSLGEERLVGGSHTGSVASRNSECGIRSEDTDENYDVQMQNSECGTVLSQMRNSECGVRNEDTDEKALFDSAWEV